MKHLLSLAVVLFLIAPAFCADKHQPITDDTLTDQVRVKLANDQDVGGLNIQVDVKEGTVTLSGKVRTDHQKSKAEKIAKKVKGINSVVNKLVISPD